MPYVLGVLSVLARESSNSSLYCILPEVVLLAPFLWPL